MGVGALLVELLKLFVVEYAREWAQRMVARGRAWKEKLKRRKEAKPDDGNDTLDSK